MTANNNPQRLLSIHLNGDIGASVSPEAEHERRVAIHDVLDGNHFALSNGSTGPYRLTLSSAQGRLMFNVALEDGEAIVVYGLSMTPFRSLMKDYFQICESYYQAIRLSTPAQIETLDMARRGLHNEGSDLLLERLKGKIDIDFDTSRRLFTLITALFWRGA